MCSLPLLHAVRAEAHTGGWPWEPALGIQTFSWACRDSAVEVARCGAGSARRDYLQNENEVRETLRAMTTSL